MVRTFKQFFVLLIFVLGAVLPLNAQNQEATLTVFGDGANKEEAIKVALRSAIEQAFGVFVSSNTKVINDDVVKDEIATVASGNVKHFDVISEDYRDGKCYVSVSAIVSVGKLISYCKQQGLASEATIDVESFLMNQKMKELNEKNMKMSFQHFLEQRQMVYEDACSGSVDFFDYQVKVEEPQVVLRYRSPHRPLSDPPSFLDEQTCEKMGRPFQSTGNNYYRIRCHVNIKLNNNISNFNKSLAKLVEDYKGIFKDIYANKLKLCTFYNGVYTDYTDSFKNLNADNVKLNTWENSETTNLYLDKIYDFELSDGIHKYTIKRLNFSDFYNEPNENWEKINKCIGLVDGVENMDKFQIRLADREYNNGNSGNVRFCDLHELLLNFFAGRNRSLSKSENNKELNLRADLYYTEDELRQIKSIKIAPKVRASEGNSRY